jgi:hypothetical protein
MNSVSLAPALFGLLIYTGQGMELTNLFLNAETNKTAAIVVKLLEHCLGRGYTVWMENFYSSPDLAWFMKSKKTGGVET